MDFDTWWRVTGQLDEGGKDDWRECWYAAVAAERERCAKIVDEFANRAWGDARSEQWSDEFELLARNLRSPNV